MCVCVCGGGGAGDLSPTDDNSYFFILNFSTYFTEGTNRSFQKTYFPPAPISSRRRGEGGGGEVARNSFFSRRRGWRRLVQLLNPNEA